MAQSKNIRTDAVLDNTDLEIVAELQRNGRITNAELAERVGVAPSTSIARVRSLLDRNVITGFTAEVNPRALGLELQVLISVTMRSGARQKMNEFADQLVSVPEVTQLFFLGGVEDFLVHLMARDADHVREFVSEYLSEHPAVSSTRTSIVFRHSQNPVGLG